MITYIPYEFLKAETVEIRFSGNENFYMMKNESNTWHYDNSVSDTQMPHIFKINSKYTFPDPQSAFYLDDKDNIFPLNFSGKSGTDSLKNFYIQENTYNKKISSEKFLGLTDFNIINNQKAYNIFLSTHIEAKMIFKSCLNYHFINAVWIQPNGRIFDITEYLLNPSENESETVFTLNLRCPECEYLHGMWNIKLMIDGHYTAEDHFRLYHDNGLSAYSVFELKI